MLLTMPNGAPQPPRANDIRHGTESSSRGWLEVLVGRSVFSFQLLRSEIAEPDGNPILPTTLNHVINGYAWSPKDVHNRSLISDLRRSLVHSPPIVMLRLMKQLTDTNYRILLQLRHTRMSAQQCCCDKDRTRHRARVTLTSGCILMGL